MAVRAFREFLPAGSAVTGDALLGRFLDGVSARGLDLYPAQEEAVLELFGGRNVILNTPTGSGKSLVAAALHFRSLAAGRRSVYTSPIKALVNEKFLALCAEFGPEQVGMATGDASINRGAPILCCTAEILANHALCSGEEAPFDEVVMDEFHYYSDRERGVAWQVPLLTMKRAQFLLMSATLGDTHFFAENLTALTGKETTVVRGVERPVPLEFRYVETPMEETVGEILRQGEAPVYVVHFTQNEAAQSAQELSSLNACGPEIRAGLKEALSGFRFTSPYGRDLKRFLQNGIGVHHAGLLPKYRLLVESLAQKGLLPVICGTDTLGVGVNIPIRTVLLTRLSKYDGTKVRILSARDFHQITGRAGRRGFDTIGYVAAQAPEHVVENAKMESRAGGDPKKLRKLVRRKPPPGFVGWSEETFRKLQVAAPEPLQSRFQVTHGMVLQVLGREGDGCRALQKLIRDCHDPESAKAVHRRRAWQLFRSLAERSIIGVIPRGERRSGGRKLQVHVSLQDDFSLHNTLSLYLIDTLALLDPEAPSYPADVLTLCEAITEDPEIILRRQLAKLKDEAMREMKADGVPYEERIARLEELEHPKPCREFVYRTFNAFAEQHPWVGTENIRLKSIAREMFENFRGFGDYVKDYDLHRVEGILLRHLSAVWKVLAQTVPLPLKTPAVEEMEAWLAGVVRGTDASLLAEWERMRSPDAPVAAVEPAREVDVTRNVREFTALVRAEVFRFLRPLAAGNYEGSVGVLVAPPGQAWSADRLGHVMDGYYDDHERIRLDPEARNGRHTHVEISQDGQSWRVCQVLIDPDERNDWQGEFRVDLAAARESGRPSLELVRVGPVVE
jgi:superfamily II RNA helicase